MSTENHQEWAEQRRREQARVSVCKLEGTGCLFQEFSEIASFCMLRKNESRTTRPSRRSHPPQLSGDSLARKSHPPIILELSASRALLETVQGSAVLLALNPSSNPWHTLRTRWYLFGSTFFSRKTTWNPCINTLLLAKDTALFCIPLQTRKWPLHFKSIIHELVHEENTHTHEETTALSSGSLDFPVLDITWTFTQQLDMVQPRLNLFSLVTIYTIFHFSHFSPLKGSSRKEKCIFGTDLLSSVQVTDLLAS